MNQTRYEVSERAKQEVEMEGEFRKKHGDILI